MRKYIKGFLLVVVLLGFYFVLAHFFPKDAGRYPVFLILFLADYYLYSSYTKMIKSWKKPVANFTRIIYWLPAILIGVLIAGSFLLKNEESKRVFFTLVGGFVIVGYTAKLIPMLLLLIADGIRFIKSRKFKPVSSEKPKESSERKISRSAFLRKAGLITGGLMLSSLLLGMLKWVHDFKIWRERIHLPNLPESFDGFRIVQFSDIHLGSWLSKGDLEDAVKVINEIEPDIIFFTGDLVNFASAEAFEFKDILAGLTAKHGVTCILGNHDYGDYKHWSSPQAKEKNMQQLYHFYDSLGWKLLRNENYSIKRGDDEISILGVENWGSFRRFQKYGDLEEAFKGSENSPVRILLSHDPSHFARKVRNFHSTIDLTLSGHTHGGQFGIEIPGLRWSPVEYMYKYWAGLYSVQNKMSGSLQHLYVNRGIGSIGYPGRVGILPEITVIELSS